MTSISRPFAAAFHALLGGTMRRERGRTLLTLAGLALGVAVLVAIDLASDSAVGSFRDTLGDVAGRATLVVRGNGAGLAPELIGRIAAHPGVESVSPLVSGSAWFEPAAGPPVTLLVLGVDFLAAEEKDVAAVRDLSYALLPGRTPWSFLTDRGGLVFTRRFAERHGLKLGDPVRLAIGGVGRSFTVAAWIESGPLADTLDGNLVAGDIGVVDSLLGRGGRIDRFDLTTTPGADLDTLAASLRTALAGFVLVERPETRGARVEEMLAAFRFNLDMLGRIAMLVGAFLIYNTMSIAVVRRRGAIGTLRALGLDRGSVRRVFLAEGVIFGLAGGVLGAAAGVLLARLALATVTTAIAINFVETHATRVALSPRLLLEALVFAVGLALVAAAPPAAEAAATAPANTMRAGTLEARRHSLGWRFAFGLAALAFAALAVSIEPGRHRLPLAGYAAAAAIVAGFALWSRPAVWVLARALRPPFARVFGAEGLLAVASTRAALGRASVAVAGLTVALAMTVAVAVMVASFRDTVIGWMAEVLRADLYVSPALQPGQFHPEPMPGAFAERVARLPGVAAVDPYRGRRVTIAGRETWLGAGRFDVVRFTNRTLDGRPAGEALRRARALGRVIVSEAFARKFGVGRGGRVAVPTPQGDVELTIEAVYRDFSSEQGLVIMDRALYLEHYDDPRIDSVAVYLAAGADRTALRAAIEQAARDTAGMPAIVVRANQDLRAAALDAFNRTFAITYALEVIAVIVSVLGVATTLLAQVLDRRQEIATLRWIGASRARVRKVIVLESSLIALAGTTLGALSGIALSFVLTRVIMLESFGWTIEHRVPLAVVALVSAIGFTATLLAGLLPAAEAARLGVSAR